MDGSAATRIGSDCDNSNRSRLSLQSGRQSNAVHACHNEDLRAKAIRYGRPLAIMDPISELGFLADRRRRRSRNGPDLAERGAAVDALLAGRNPMSALFIFTSCCA